MIVIDYRFLFQSSYSSSLHILDCTVWNEWGGGSGFFWPTAVGQPYNWQTFQWIYSPAYRPGSSLTHRRCLPTNTWAHTWQEGNGGEGANFFKFVVSASETFAECDAANGFSFVLSIFQNCHIFGVWKKNVYFNDLKARCFLLVM